MSRSTLTRVSYGGRLLGINPSRLVIFYGDVKMVHLPTDNPDDATLYRVKVPGGPQEKMSGKKIVYLRRTNEAHIEEGRNIIATP